MGRVLGLFASLALVAGAFALVIPRLLNSLLYYPSRAEGGTPARAGLAYEDLDVPTEDGERLHAWWIPARGPSAGHVLLCHGNAGNVADRVIHAKLLVDAGLDVMLFDYRGYGRSSGAPDEEGTYRDARAARVALLGRPGADASRLLYLGESLGAAVALALALEFPPRGLVLQSAFTSVRDMGRLHYPMIPAIVIPDAYPNLRRIRELKAPLLVLHGDRDDIVPLSHGQALFAAAPEPKQLRVFEGLGHNDLVVLAGTGYADVIIGWFGDTGGTPRVARLR
jgi:fermentation-respiration switch protein FrsA (DUF1100 family)